MVFKHEGHKHKEPPGKGADMRFIIVMILVAGIIIFALLSGLFQGIVNFFSLFF